MATNDLITTDVAAERLQRSTVYVLRLLKQGELEGQRIGPDTRGGQWLISADSVAALLERWAADPPRRGRRPAGDTPSPAALAQRRSRARRTAQTTEKRSVS